MESKVEPERTTEYKNYTIVCSATHDTIGFIPSAAIMWQTKRGTSTTYFLRLSKLYPTQQEAAAAALEEAKAWIDGQPPI